MMWGATLILMSFVAAQVTSQEIKVQCHEFNDLPPSSEPSPSELANLTVMLVKVRGEDMLNISWAVNIDGSHEYLTGIRIVISGQTPYHCEYHPAFAKPYLQGSSYGFYVIQAANLPLGPPERFSYKFTMISVPRSATVTSKYVTVPTGNLFKYFTAAEITSESSKVAVHGDVNFTGTVVAIFGGLVGLIILSSCYIVYKRCGASFATLLGFRKLPTSPVIPIPVLVVYPAENSAFQQAVVELAEFLQWHGGCSVAVDMWQQGKIAELGPMRWLAEQAKAAHRVLIVCPQPSSQRSHSPLNHSFPEPSIPAAAHDLYPLILNMVASHAKSASDLARFWVVQLGEQQDKKPCNLAPQLMACKTFCLMKDLNKLCRSLHTQSQDGKKMSNLIFRPAIDYSEKCTVNIREAVEKLGGRQSSIFREGEPLRSVVAVV
uniref:Interleukin 17 receptor B n=1 Tax=Epinephelus coioides TaxID=94232 RepID=A0A286LNP5_EPICO|nr:interleukin 17 receptor B [Epinephelus coioides]